MLPPSKSLLPMDGRLQGDDRGIYRDEILDRLGEHEKEIRTRLDGGLPPEEFQKLQKLHQAVRISRLVVQTAWKALHP